MLFWRRRGQLTHTKLKTAMHHEHAEIASAHLMYLSAKLKVIIIIITNIA